MRRLTPVLAVLLAALGPACARADVLPPVKHAFVIVLENSDFETNFPSGSAPQAPYLARTLTGRGQLLTHYYGTSHVSLGNYISMVSGQAPNPDTQSDCLPQFRDVFPGVPAPDYGQVLGSGCVYPASTPTIADQLEAKGLTWRGYMEDMGDDKARDGRATCSHPAIGTTDGTQSATADDQYATRHNPFMYFHSVIDDQASCDAHVVNLRELHRDLAQPERTPAFSFITPDLCSDGHDSGGCKDGKRPGGLASVDEFLRGWVPEITQSRAFADGGLLVITWDEGSGPTPGSSEACCGEPTGYNTVMPGIAGMGGGRTGTVVISPFTVPGSVNDTPYNHYALLRSWESLFGLSYLGYAGMPSLKAFGSDVFGQAAAVDLRGPAGQQPVAAGDARETAGSGGTGTAVVNPCRLVPLAGQGRALRPGSLVAALRVKRARGRASLVVTASRRTRAVVHVGGRFVRRGRTRACAPLTLSLGRAHGRASLKLSVRGHAERRTVFF